MEHNVIALEGLDGSGKTTVGRMVADQTGGKYVYCMDGNPIAPYRRLFDRQSTQARFLYYVAIPLLNYRRIENIRQKADVFLDRTIASTIAYHRAYGLSERWIRIIPRHLMDQIGHMLYFTVSESERRRRMLQRESEGSALSPGDHKSLELNEKIDNEYRQVFTDRSIYIDTDGRDPKAISEEVIERLYGKETN